MKFVILLAFFYIFHIILSPKNNVSITAFWALKGKSADVTIGTRDLSALSLKVTSAVSVSLKSLRFKALNGTATVMCRRVS